MNGDNQPISVNNRFETLTQAGMAAIERGELTEARQQFEAALQESPQNPEAHKNLGLTLQGLGLSDEAEQCFRQSIALDATYWKGFANLSLLFQSREDWPNALQAAQQAAQLNPLDAILLNNLAQFHKLNGNYADAELSFLKAIALAPHEIRITAHYGSFLLERERLSEALYFLESAAERAREDLPLSDRMELRNQAVSACIALERHVQAETLEAQILAEKVARHFDVILALHRQADSPETLSDDALYHVYSQWGRACLTLKQFPQATSLLESALLLCEKSEKTDDAPALHHSLAYAYCQLRHYANAERHIIDYLRCNAPDREPVIFLLLVILEERGGFEHRKELSALLQDTDWQAMKALMQAAMRQPELSERLPTLPEALESTAPLPPLPDAHPFSLPQLEPPATSQSQPAAIDPSIATTQASTAPQGLARTILADSATSANNPDDNTNPDNHTTAAGNTGLARTILGQGASQTGSHATFSSPHPPASPETAGGAGLARQILRQNPGAPDSPDSSDSEWQLVFSSKNPAAHKATSPPPVGLARLILGQAGAAGTEPQASTAARSTTTPETTRPQKSEQGLNQAAPTSTRATDISQPAPKGLAREILERPE